MTFRAPPIGARFKFDACGMTWIKVGPKHYASSDPPPTVQTQHGIQPIIHHVRSVRTTIEPAPDGKPSLLRDTE